MRTAFLAAVLAAILPAGKVKTEPMPFITVKDEVLNPVDPRLFGQFLERASFGESGPEAAADEKGDLRPDCMTLLKRYGPPIVRFPGGTDIDHIDWTDMISNVPGRGKERPLTTGQTGKTITNRFGYDEYFRLRDTLKCQTILVLNLLDGLGKRRDPVEAAVHACGLVAYTNATQGQKLPEGMPDWPAVRTKNGHSEPFGAEYIQLGNEWWCGKFADRVKGLYTDGEEVDKDGLAAWTVTVLHAYIKVIRQIDPDIPLIIDGQMWHGVEETVLSDSLIRREVRYLAYHSYAPMGPSVFFDGETEVPYEKLDRDLAFTALSAMPGAYDEAGQNLGYGSWPDPGIKLGYRICFTEWNWNGWGFNEVEKAIGLPWHDAASLGVASFIHGIMRGGTHADFATQSMFLGHGWAIAAVKYDPEEDGSAHFGAQGRTSLFYKDHAGTELMASSQGGVETVNTTYKIGRKWRAPHPVAMIESAATRGNGTLYVHLVNRYFNDDKKVAVDISSLKPGADGMLYVLKGKETPSVGPEKWLEETSRTVSLHDGKVTLTLPARSVCCLEVKL